MLFQLQVQLHVHVQKTNFTCKNSLKFRISLRRKLRRMAIAYWTPPEYGPVNPPQPEQNQLDANNNDTGAPVQNNPAPGNQVVSLFSGFVSEMIGVFRGNQQSLRGRRNLQDIRIEQDNQVLPDLIPQPLVTLPDLVTCSAGMSFRYRQAPVLPLSPGPSSPQSTMDFELEFKLTLGHESEEQEQVPPTVPVSPQELYRTEGARLRQIADSFERSRTSSTSQTPTFELKIVITVALPTVALLGLGISYLRRS